MVQTGPSGVAGTGRVPAVPNGRRSDARRIRLHPDATAAPTAKLSRPRIPYGFVPRRRLVDQLDAGSRTPVTLVCAGAGWGKTLLVASWADTATSPGPVAWLSIDREDNNSPGVFWSNVVAALEISGGVPNTNGHAHLGRAARVDDAFFGRVTEALSRLPGPVVLVLDDVDLIDNPELLRSIGFLLRYQPTQLRLILIARSDPDLALHRLRAAGQLTEIHTGDLRFTAEEAVELLAYQRLHLPYPEVQSLVDRTEGWPAGLRLAATYLGTRGESDGVAGFFGDTGGVADYLIGEVLAQQPPEVRRFLLYTSIADPLSGELADAITAGTGSQAVLERLEHENAFVAGLGTKPGWFHYHPLLGDLLRHLLVVEAPTVVPTLHRRAARWYSHEHEPLKALTHAAAAADWPLLGRIMVADLLPFILSTHRVAMGTVLDQVPPEQFDATAELKVCAGVLMFYAGNYDAIPPRVAEALLLTQGRPAAERIAVEIAIRSLEVAVARVNSDMTGLIAATSEILRMLAHVRLADMPSTLQYRAIAVNNKGVGLLWTGDLDRADHYLRSALTSAAATGVELVEINAGNHVALLELIRGALRQADRHARQGCELAERRGWRMTVQAVPGYAALALIHLERYQIVAAEAALSSGFESYHTDAEPVQRIVLGIGQAYLRLATGDLNAARDAVAKTRHEAGARQPARVPARWLTLAEAEIDLVDGHPDRVLARLDGQRPEGPLAGRLSVCVARAALAVGLLDRAEAALAPVRDAPGTDLVAAVSAWIVTALLADDQRRGDEALEALDRALALAEPEGIRRPFVTVERSRLAALCGRYLELGRGHLNFVADLVTDMVPDGVRRDEPPIAVALSTREREVLRYLPTMLNAAEIADELHISINTVKAHLRAIYRKLDVSRRREAVIRARALGLLF